MQRILIFILLLGSCELLAQGKFASSSWKNVIGKSCKSESEFPELKEFTLLGSTLMTDLSDPEKKTVAVFSKGKTIVVLFEGNAEGAGDQLTIIDVIEMRNVPKTQGIKVGECRDGLNENTRIIALVEKSKSERLQAVKAWTVNVDKLRIDALSPKNVTCIGNLSEDLD